MLKGRITSIDVDADNDVTFYFDDPAEGFNTREFKPRSETRITLEVIEDAIQKYNFEVELIRAALDD